jgi:DNA-binding transcriptional ArsR family regulator
MVETGRSEHGAGGRSTLLPEHSLLSLSEYLDMQQAIGNETRFRILDLLVEEGAHSATELRSALGVESNTLHYHLDTLVDVGLVENRKRKEESSDGLYSYYRATSLGEGILEHGVRELMREEWELLDEYGGYSSD